MKRNRSTTIETASARVAGMESIAPTLDFGAGLNVDGYKAAITDTLARRTAYNTLLSQADEAKMAFDAAEKRLSDLSDRMLAAVGGKFGRNSMEYVKSGGKVKSGRRKPRTVPVLLPEVKKAA